MIQSQAKSVLRQHPSFTMFLRELREKNIKTPIINDMFTNISNYQKLVGCDMSAEKANKSQKEAKANKNVKANENTVLIGKKPLMNYVVACLTFFNAGAKKVVIKARGRAISRAVDTVELLKRAFLKDLQVENISIGTEEVTRSEGQKTNVSTIEITVERP